MHEVLVNRLGGLSLPRKSVVRLTDRPDMTLDVYRGRKTTNQQSLCFCDNKKTGETGSLNASFIKAQTCYVVIILHRPSYKRDFTKLHFCNSAQAGDPVVIQMYVP